MKTESTVWEQTLKVLARISSSAEDRDNAYSGEDNWIPPEQYNRPDVECGKPLSTFVSILERTSPTEVRLCWCDATTGKYGDQRWRLQMARSKAVCALSGEIIHRGDLAYRPCARGQNFWNAKHHISAEALAKLEEQSVDRFNADLGEIAASSESSDER